MTESESSQKYFLIVDDLEHQRIAMKTAIQAVVPRSEFIEASNFNGALEIVKGKTDPIDLAVVDLKLSDNDEQGIELIRTIKREYHRRGAKTILITAYPDEKNRIMANEAGADGYISKLNDSVTVELQDMIRKLLGL